MQSRLPFYYGWMIVAVVFVTMAIGVNARTAFSLLFPPIIGEFGWDRGVTAGAFSFGFVVSGIMSPLIGRLMLYDALAMKFRELKLRRNPECPVCGDHPTVTKLIDYQQFCGIPGHVPEPEIVEGDITPLEVKARLDRGDKFQFIDVREPHEFEIARIPGTKLIPLGHVVARMSEIDPEVDTIVHCKGGVRSAKAIEALKRAGYTGKLINLRGGITAWAEEVDPRVAKY